MFLIFKGFNEIITIRLPKQMVKKHIAIELVPSLHEPLKSVKGYLGLAEKFLKIFFQLFRNLGIIHRFSQM
jgi:hypothetical protein